MKCRQQSWLLRVDPKDPNAILGMYLHFHTLDERQKDEFVDNGVPLWALAVDVHDRLKNVRVKVKWVYTLETINAERV